MLNAIIRWAVPTTALLIAGPLALLLTAGLRATDGSSHATILVCSSPILGLLVAIGIFLLAGGVGVTGARIVGLRMGLFSAGLVLAWAAWGTARVDLLMRQPGANSMALRLALEGALLGAMGVGLALVIARMSRDRPSPGDGGPVEEAQPLSKLGLVVGVALVAAAAAGWFIASEPLKGQTFAAAAVAGIAAALAGRLTGATGETEPPRSPVLPFFLAVAILAAASPVLATVVHAGGGGVVDAATTGRLAPLAWPVPLDWIAGAFVGIPIGLSWADSMLDRHVPQA